MSDQQESYQGESYEIGLCMDEINRLKSDLAAHKAALADVLERAAKGWAVEWDGEIDIRTVSSTERAAKINWLVAGLDNPRPMLITRNDTDEYIEARWVARVQTVPVPVALVEVSITKRSLAPPDAASYAKVLEAARTIFSKRHGAYGTALIMRGDVALSEDLEELREALAAIGRG